MTVLRSAKPRLPLSEPDPQNDFDGWVQERGLYFMDPWDREVHTATGVQRSRRAAAKGRLIAGARYGKGYYIYTGYAFFRQLPFGVRRDSPLRQSAERGT